MIDESSNLKAQRWFGVFGLVTNGLFRDNENTNLEFGTFG